MSQKAAERSFRRELRRVLLVPIAALLLLAALLGIGILQLVWAAQWVDRTDQVIAAADRLQRLMIDQETGARGFLLSRNPAALDPWKSATYEVPIEFAHLAALIADNPTQQQQLNVIRQRHAAWQQYTADRIAHPDSSSTSESQLVGKRQMDAIRREVDHFLRFEDMLKLQHIARSRNVLRFLLVSGGLLSLLLGFGTAWWLYRKITTLNEQNEVQVAALGREQQRLQTMLSSIGDAVIATDGDGMITLMNSIAEECTGWTESEVWGKPLSEVFRIVNETTREEVESPVEKVKKTGLVCGLANHTVLIRRDGREISIDDSGAPIRDVDGSISGIILVFRNIDERRAAERERDESRHALQESERRLQTFAHSIPTLAWMARPDGWIFWYNRRWYEYTGTTPEQMTGWGWQLVHDATMLPSVMERWTTSIRTGEPFEMVFPLRSADGELRAFLTRVVPFRDSQGQITHWFGTNTDIEELERTRQALASERGRLAALINHMPVGLIFADSKGAIAGGNAQVESILRHPVLLSHDVAEYKEWISYHPDGRQVEGHEYPLARTLSDGGVHSGEYLYQRGDGTKAWLQFTSAPIFDEEKRTVGAVVATLDIDDRKRTEQDLREKSELIELAQTAVNAGYWSYFPSTSECFLSPGEQVIFGIRDTARPTIGLVLDRIHAADRDAVIKALEEGMQSGVYFAEFRVSREDGALRWLAGQGRVLTKSDGEKYMVGINFDVTNQKITEDALRKSEKLAVAGRLAASIAHEINNPLEAVTNLLYLVRTNTKETATREHIVTAEDELTRVSQIVTQSLRFHRQSTVPTIEKLSALVESAASIYKSRLNAENVQFERDYHDAHLVCCYSSELRQVFGNFVGNAFDAIRNGGTIRVRTRDAIDWQTGEPGVRVTVADNGHGMDEPTLQRIFEPFYTTKGINGTGLGLWISRDILKKHHAKLKVRSNQRPQFRGTLFSVFFPLDAIRGSEPKAV